MQCVCADKSVAIKMAREIANNPANEFFILIFPGRRRPDTNFTQISRIEPSLMMVKLSSNDQFCRWTGTDGTAERDPWFQIKSRTREKKDAAHGRAAFVCRPGSRIGATQRRLSCRVFAKNTRRTGFAGKPRYRCHWWEEKQCRR